MKIAKFIPPVEPRFSLTFTLDEGWAVVAALADWAKKNPGAAEANAWTQWAHDLDRELRS